MLLADACDGVVIKLKPDEVPLWRPGLLPSYYTLMLPSS